MTDPFEFDPTEYIESEVDLDFNQALSEFGQLPTESVKEIEFKQHAPAIGQGEIGFVLEAICLQSAVKTICLSYPDRKAKGRVLQCVLSSHSLTLNSCDGGFLIQIPIELPIPVSGLSDFDSHIFVLDLHDLLALLFASDAVISFKLNASRTIVQTVSGLFTRPLAILKPTEFRVFGLLDGYSETLSGQSFQPASLLQSLEAIAPSVNENDVSDDYTSLSVKPGFVVGGTRACIISCNSSGLADLRFQVRPYWCAALAAALNGVQTATFIRLDKAVAIRAPNLLIVIEAIAGCFPDELPFPPSTDSIPVRIQTITTALRDALQTFQRLYPQETTIELQYAPRKRAKRKFADMCRLRVGTRTASVTVEIPIQAEVDRRKSYRLQLGVLVSATTWLRAPNTFLDFYSKCLLIEESGRIIDTKALAVLEERPEKHDMSTAEAASDNV